MIRKIIAKYGLENFSREVLEYVKPEEVFLKESEWIKRENTLIPNGYNLTVESLGGFYQLNEETDEIVFKGHSNWEDLSEDEKVKRLQKMHSAARTPEARQKFQKETEESTLIGLLRSGKTLRKIAPKVGQKKLERQ